MAFTLPIIGHRTFVISSEVNLLISALPRMTFLSPLRMPKMVIMRVIVTQSYQKNTHLMDKTVMLMNTIAMTMNMENLHLVKGLNASLVKHWSLVATIWVGLLSHFIANFTKVIDAMMYSESHWISVIRRTSLFKGPSITTSEEYSQYTTRYLFSNPDSSLARSFQERNLTSRRQKRNSPAFWILFSRFTDKGSSEFRQRKISKIVCSSLFKFWYWQFFPQELFLMNHSSII